MTNLRALHDRGHSWCLGLAFVLANLLCASAMAQTDSDNSNKRPLLTPAATLTGAFVEAALAPLSALPRKSGFSGHLTWQWPTAVAARGNYIYVVDGGRRQIFRYDLALQTMMPFTDYDASSVSGIAVARDLSLFVADANARQVLHFAFDGRLLQKFANDMELTRPVAVLPDERSANVLVADNLRSQIVVFNSLGRVVSALRPMTARSIEAMAQGPDGLYLVDRVNRQIVVVGHDGAERYVLGKGTLKMPGAIAVDQFNRVFVSDIFDNTIKVYEREQLLATIGGAGANQASFNRITGLSVDQNMLYVVDSLNARIRTFRVALPGLSQ